MDLKTTRSKIPHIYSVSTAVIPQLRSVCVCRVAEYFETSEQNDPKLPSTLQCERYPIYFLLVTLSVESRCVSLYNQPLLSHRLFQSVTNETNLEYHKVKVPHTVLLLLPSPKIPSVSASRFRATGHFKTSVPNDPRTTVNTTRSKASHMCSTTTPSSVL